MLRLRQTESSLGGLGVALIVGGLRREQNPPLLLGRFTCRVASWGELGGVEAHASCLREGQAAPQITAAGAHWLQSTCRALGIRGREAACGGQCGWTKSSEGQEQGGQPGPRALLKAGLPQTVSSMERFPWQVIATPT